MSRTESNKAPDTNAEKGEAKRVGMYPTSGKSYRILYSNAQSVIKKIEELKATVCDMQPDIIALCETWTNDDHTSAFLSIPGYSIICRHDRLDTTSGAGGGLLLYAKCELKIAEDVQTVFSSFNQCCSVKLPCAEGKEISLVLVYRPHRLYTDSVTVDTNNEKLCSVIRNAQRPCVILGDFNYSDIDWEVRIGDAHSRSFIDAIQDCFFVQHVNFPTRISSGTMPDLVLSSDSYLIRDVNEAGTLGSSDHTMLLVDIDENPPRNNSTEFVPDWRKADMDKLRQDLVDIEWEKELDGLGTEESWKLFKLKLEVAQRDCVPLKKRRNVHRPLWMKRNVMRVIRKKRRLWRTYRETSDYNEYKAYKAIEKEVKNAVRNAKNSFEKKLAKNAKKNPKAFYSYLKSRTSNKESVGPLKEGDKVISDDKNMADTLNFFFSSVFTAEDLTSIPHMENVYKGSTPLISVKFLANTIQDKIDNLRSTTAPGVDGFTPALLKPIKDIISLPLAIIYSRSLEEGVVPEEWKKANVTPVFKKGAKSSAGNYRPISLTCIICKVMEAIIRDSIIKHLAENKLITSSQHGFTAHRSCLTNLLEYLETLTRLVDEGHCIDIVYLDFSKAFDKVPHVRLLNVLHAHGIDGLVLNWIAAWLNDRQQRVVLNGTASVWNSVLSGVPQGSVLGPTLFVIFINSLDDAMVVVGRIISKFADDTKAGRKVMNCFDKETLQKDINNLLDWADKWQMTFNDDKCKVMHLGHGNLQFDYTMGSHTLEAVEVEKDVGVWIHNSLKPSYHCAKAVVKANQVLGQMSRAFHYRDKIYWVRLYKTYVRPHLEYCIQAWCPWTSADRDLLESVQKRAVRMISGLQGESYVDKLLEIGLPSLDHRRQRGDMIEVWKILNKVEDVDPAHWFVMAAESSSRMTRQTCCPLQIATPTYQHEFRKNFFSVRCVPKWNSLPDCVKLAKSIDMFKAEFDKYSQGL